MKQAAVMLIIKDGLILSIERKRSPGKFGLIGGRVENNETIYNAAVRETKEECGIDIKNATWFFTRLEDREHIEDNDFETYCFFAEEWVGEPKSLEGLEVRWLTESQLTGELGAFPAYNKKAISSFKREFPSIELL